MIRINDNITRSPHLTDPVKARLRKLAGRKWTKDGAIIITAEKHRSQHLNRELAHEKLAELIQNIALKPNPPGHRKNAEWTLKPNAGRSNPYVAGLSRTRRKLAQHL